MATLKIPADNKILYFRRDRADFAFLSHFYPAPIVLDGTLWPTVEHFYQAQKSFDPDYRAAVMNAIFPGAAKRLAAYPNASGKGSKYSWFKKNGQSPRPDWKDVKLDVMRRADLAKFSQHQDLRELLLATRNTELIEDSPSELFWGIGPDGQGLNWAGRVLMEVRASLQTLATGPFPPVELRGVTMAKPGYETFGALAPFFEVVMKGLQGLVEGEHYFDTFAEDAIFESRYQFPGWPVMIRGRADLMASLSGYGKSIELHSGDALVVHRSQDSRVVILEYEVHGKVLSSGARYDNRFISVITIEKRKIIHWRDYMDSLTAWSALNSAVLPGRKQ